MKKNKPLNRPQPAQIAIAEASDDLPGLMRLKTMLRDCQERFS